jgi:hypothetical protein
VVVVGFAAVFVLQAAVAQDAQLAVPPAWALVPEREPDVPQAAQPVAPDALPEPIAALVAHSVVSPGDPPDAPPVLGEPLADRTAAGRADLRDDPQADCLAVHC